MGFLEFYPSLGTKRGGFDILSAAAERANVRPPLDIATCVEAAMPKFEDISRQRFGRLIAVCEWDRPKTQWRWLCRCDCGNELITSGNSLRMGRTNSCGCLKRDRIRQVGYKNKTHGESTTALYGVWGRMWQRCTNPNCDKYEYYGGRGIKVCDRWRNFDAFVTDMGPRPEGYWIERINNNGNYEPSNCKWASAKEQRSNQREYKPKTYPRRRYTVDVGTG